VRLLKSILRTIADGRYLSQPNLTTMSTSRINLSAHANRSEYYKRKIRIRFAAKRAEIIAWALFFGIGVTYVIAAIVVAVV